MPAEESRRGPFALVLMGVTGSGKTTIGELLADQLSWEFLEGDDFHPQANVAKMANGVPLTDEDRYPWLGLLADRMAELVGDGRDCILACSALKAEYRDILAAGPSVEVKFVYLEATEKLIGQRLSERVHRYMPPSLLRSQFESLEPPEDALVVDVSATPQDAVRQIRESMGR